MSVPKAKRKKKKNNLNGITKYDLERAQRKIDRQYEGLELEAAQDATRTMSALYSLALHNAFKFGVEEFAIITREVDAICDRFQNPEYTWDDVYTELEEIGMTKEEILDGMDERLKDEQAGAL